jgi:mannose-1-phosphate guanylyltransferase
LLIIPVILSGGSGTRLWPLSTPEKPKQFLSLVSDKSLLQETVLRCNVLRDVASPMIIGNVAHRELISSQLKAINIQSGTIILEPIGRNTAPAIAVAAIQALDDHPDPLLFVMPSDHVIQNQKIFNEAVEIAVLQAKRGKLVTFGIVPTHPETGYGYIRRGKKINEKAYEVNSFVEKPNLEKANEYLAEGNYYWNSGMFLFSAKRYLEEMEKFSSDILMQSKAALEKSSVDNEFIFLEKFYFEQCRSDSIDYAVMEKTNDAVVVPLDAGWSDVGSWNVVADLAPKDKEGNTIIGDVNAINVKNSYIRSTSQPLRLAGINNAVIVESNGKTLILDKTVCQDVKALQ